MDLVLAKLPDADNRDYLAQSWAALISRIECRPVAASIKYAEREVDRAIEMSLSEVDAQEIATALACNTILDNARCIAQSGCIDNGFDFQIATEFISCVENLKEYPDLYAQIGCILLSYEDRIRRQP